MGVKPPDLNHLMNKLPNFFIVGAPKAGTTSLYEYLSRHEEVFMPKAIKEPDYFSHEAILKQDLYYKTTHITVEKKYLALFDDVKDQKALGEASVSYLFYSGTAKKIYDFNPKAKIIILLRDPIERAYSHYLMDCRLGLIKDSFEEIILKQKAHRYTNMYYQQIVLLGEYGVQLQRYLDVFRKDQVKIFLYDQLKEDPEGLMREVCDFLEIANYFKAGIHEKHNAYAAPKNAWVEKIYQMHQLRGGISKIVPNGIKSGIRNAFFKDSKKPAMSLSAREFLKIHYEKDIEVVRSITGIDCWH